jgi:hypothetical protein
MTAFESSYFVEIIINNSVFIFQVSGHLEYHPTTMPIKAAPLDFW